MTNQSASPGDGSDRPVLAMGAVHDTPLCRLQKGADGFYVALGARGERAGFQDGDHVRVSLDDDGTIVVTEVDRSETGDNIRVLEGQSLRVHIPPMIVREMRLSRDSYDPDIDPAVLYADALTEDVIDRPGGNMVKSVVALHAIGFASGVLDDKGRLLPPEEREPPDLPDESEMPGGQSRREHPTHEQTDPDERARQSAETRTPAQPQGQTDTQAGGPADATDGGRVQTSQAGDAAQETTDEDPDPAATTDADASGTDSDDESVDIKSEDEAGGMGASTRLDGPATRELTPVGIAPKVVDMAARHYDVDRVEFEKALEMVADVDVDALATVDEYDHLEGQGRSAYFLADGEWADIAESLSLSETLIEALQFAHKREAQQIVGEVGAAEYRNFSQRAGAVVVPNRG